MESVVIKRVYKHTRRSTWRQGAIAAVILKNLGSEKRVIQMFHPASHSDIIQSSDYCSPSVSGSIFIYSVDITVLNDSTNMLL